MRYNYHYYVNKTAQAFPGKGIVVVRQESLWDDLRSVERYVGGNPLRHFEREGPTITHGSKLFRHRAKLDPALGPILCCAIPDEIRSYKYLVSEALNLGPAEKSSSLMGLLQRCNASSFEDLGISCGWQNDLYEWFRKVIHSSHH